MGLLAAACFGAASGDAQDEGRASSPTPSPGHPQIHEATPTPTQAPPIEVVVDQTDEPGATISVVGFGQVDGAAGAILLRFSINHNDSPKAPVDPRMTFLEQREAALNAAESALFGLGVSAEDIYRGSAAFSRHYAELLVELDDPTLVPEAIRAVDAVLSGRWSLTGAQAQGIADDCAAMEGLAREEAVANAQRKAEHMAELLDLRLVGIQEVTEEREAPQYYGHGPAASGRCPTEESVPSVWGGPGGNPDEIVVSGTVNVTYLVEQKRAKGASESWLGDDHSTVRRSR